MNHRHPLELLAPARDRSVAIAAIDHGADAVYIGPSHHGARAAAGNGIDDIARVCDYAHRFGARVYATVNTLVYDNELRDVEHLIADLYRAEVDALIVQDLGLLRLDLPPIALHASTQCDIRTPEKARFLAELGFTQLVLARELTVDEISAIAAAVDTPLEAFVHGALCVSYSGRCQVSHALKRRSANRGECAQVCRLPFDLLDEAGNVYERARHLLSLRDLNMSDRLEAMIDAGVSSFKIEGRLKDVAYVKTVVAHYRQRLDAIIDARGCGLLRSSRGESRLTFTPDVERGFNRSFTSYFFNSRRPANGTSMAGLDTPKSVGPVVGRVTAVKGRALSVKATVSLHNGDGLSYRTERGDFDGFRVNRVEGSTLWLNAPVPVKVGATLYRSFDKVFDDVMSGDTARRTLRVDARLTGRRGETTLSLHLTDERGCSVTRTVELEQPLAAAQTPQADRQLQILNRLGDTVYRLGEAQVLSEVFVPASVLTGLRRDAIAALDDCWLTSRPRLRPGRRADVVHCPMGQLFRADNVANREAAALYQELGVPLREWAVELTPVPALPLESAMHTRYCLRRELGACLRDSNGRRLPQPLLLRHGSMLLKVDCDCSACEMRLTLLRR